jgi:hypothetical protein
MTHKMVLDRVLTHDMCVCLDAKSAEVDSSPSFFFLKSLRCNELSPCICVRPMPLPNRVSILRYFTCCSTTEDYLFIVWGS